MEMVLIVAWLHNISDHKHDHDGNLYEQCVQFLNQHRQPTRLVMNIIKRVSFSCEENEGERDWSQMIGGKGIKIRDIVSDAIKIQSIGDIGVRRCVQYILEKNPYMNIEDLKELILKYANEKLLRILPEFIRTEEGKKMAQPLHNEMIDILDNLEEYLLERFSNEMCSYHNA